MFAPKVRRSGQSLPCVRQRSGGAVLNDSPVGCQTRAMTEPQLSQLMEQWEALSLALEGEG